MVNGITVMVVSLIVLGITVGAIVEARIEDQRIMNEIMERNLNIQRNLDLYGIKRDPEK